MSSDPPARGQAGPKARRDGPGSAAADGPGSAPADVAGSAAAVTNLWAATLVAHGTPELRQQFVDRLLADEIATCLLYSEPGAGSDLAAVQTTAVRDGDEWIVNGQKVWTSGGREADYGLLLARTDWDQPKHRGLTFFWFPMHQAGVEVRPLRQITGDSRFNEVFLSGARVPDTFRLGDEGKGWLVLQTALAYERAVMGIAARSPSGGTDGAAAPVDQETGSAPGSAPARRRTFSPGGSIPVPDLALVDVARAAGLNGDAQVRQALARLHASRTVTRWTAARASSELDRSSSSSLASLGKLAMSQLLHAAGHLHGMLLGAEAMLDGESSPAAADANYSHLNAYFTSIGGGTDQIQRNIIGERLLGLPREPEVDRDIPFRAARRATVAADPR